MDNYIDLTLRININTGEVENMGVKKASSDKKTKEILEVYNKLSINYKNNNTSNNFEKYTKYNYNERSSLTTTTCAKI